MKYTDEQVELFVLGRLPKIQHDQLESELSSDMELRKRVEMERSLINSIQNLAEDEQAKSSIASASNSYFEQKKAKKINNIRFVIISIASAAAIVGFILSTLFSTENPLDGAKLFAENFETAPMMEIDRSEITNLDSVLSDFYRLYQIEKFEDAIEILERNNLLINAEVKILHYAASAYLSKSVQEVNKSKSLFLEIIDRPDNIYKPVAFWNLALIALKTNDFHQAKEYLTQLDRLPSNKYSERAKTLLKSL